MPTVWGLLDDRAGNRAQVCGVVERLGYSRQFKQIRYTPLVRLPNLLRGRSLCGVDQAASDPLRPPWPEMVVTAGRRLAPVALFIKRRNPSVFLVQMMSPETPSQDYDLLVLPDHDTARNRPNVLRTLGALHGITPETLRHAAAEHAPLFVPCPGFRIGLLLGGGLHKGDMRRLLSHLARVAGMASLLVTTSRRTPAFAYPMLGAALQGRPHYLYRYGQTEGANPYMGILAASDMLVVTGDSVSMCSEACATGKPVYVFVPENGLSPKHMRFLSALCGRGFARPIEDYDAEWKPSGRLDETGTVAAHIQTHSQWVSLHSPFVYSP